MVHPNFKIKDSALNATKGWIGDKEYDTGKTFDVEDPGSGEVWTSVVEMGGADAEKAVTAAAEAFPKWSNTSARQRARIILELDRLVRENKEDLAMLITMETGKALAEARAEVDYATTYSWVMAGEAERIQGDTIKANDNPSLRFFTQRVPVGPVALLCP